MDKLSVYHKAKDKIESIFPKISNIAKADAEVNDIINQYADKKIDFFECIDNITTSLYDRMKMCEDQLIVSRLDINKTKCVNNVSRTPSNKEIHMNKE